MTLPDELNQDLRDILGIPCFKFIHLAKLLRLDGNAIPEKAEEEQAFCMWWILKIYEAHGDKWRDEMTDRVKEIHARVAKRSRSSPISSCRPS